MAITSNIQVYFCIFFAVLHTEGTQNTKKNAFIINNLLHQPGWRNISNVKCIKYRNKDYIINDICDKHVTTSNCDNLIRRATIFLGSSYAQDFTIILFLLYNFQKHCFNLLNSDNDSAHKCTVTLLAKMNEIIPMAKFMKGALYAIEKCHNIPLYIHKKSRFILSNFLTNIQENETLKKLALLINSSDSITSVLLSIKDILITRNSELKKKDLSYCELKPFDMNLLWNLWNMEFDTLKSQGIYEELYIFLSDKIKNLILTTIWKKYIELGFKFDLNKGRTFLPTPPTYDIEDISQNPSINLVQHTTEVNEMKKILEEYIAQYSFRNLTQPNIEVEKQEEIKKEDTTQNPINLTEHTNELNVLKDIQQHDITQYNNSINLMQPTNEVDKQDRIKKEDFICEVKDNSNLQID
ncbi:uncharacterized protein LOC126894412 isoform X2 [Daktulosphaira vitifoliae]|uniref:uncharacterized protein LOC126894412 isoform X2 n=1 Tax=Daktulosphaira vitifoliae TaxID=58002 RepID=UPI0021AA676C|nr:uncharacterized protein LOC126894412 isoform X2 [Daktulosphaira vitifoliae]